jgi:hemolysin D
MARDLAIDFLPDALALERRKPPLAARVTVWLLVAALAAGLVWAALSPIDRVVVAHGKLVTTAPTIVVQPIETVSVRTIEVRPGDLVRKGQRLATLDPTFTEADLEQVRSKLASLRPQIARLEAELEAKRWRPAGKEPSELLQAMIHERRHAQFAAKIDAFDRQVARAEAGIVTKKADAEGIAKRLVLAREIESMRTQLAQREVGSRLQQLEAQNNRLQLERELRQSQNEQNELREEVARLEAERESYLNEWREKTAEELVAARRELQTAESQAEKAARRNALVVLSAPADAVVLDVGQRSIGSVLREAEPFITLVPLDVPLEAEMQVDPSDIGIIKAGATTRLKIDAFPFQKHGTLIGTLRTLSEDVFTTDKEKRPFYRARVALGQMTLKGVPESTRLIPGMTLTGEVKAGERTVLSYLMYPLLRGIDESFREP